MDKRALLEQLTAQLRETARGAILARNAAAAEAQSGASPQEKRESARVNLEFSNLARAQSKRATRAASELRALGGFTPGAFPQSARISVGAIVEIEDTDTGEGRTFFLTPAGAGATLTGPDGDGYFTVVTPASPIGKAVMGRRVGDVVDARVNGEDREWTICYVC